MAAYKTNCYKCGCEVFKKKRCKNPICDECKKEYDKKYYQKHKDKKKEYNKEYREKNKDNIKEYKRKWNKENQDDIKEYQREYREKNRDKKKEYDSKPEVKEKRRKYNKKRYENNKEDIREQQKEYRSRPEVKKRRVERQKERRKTDIKFNIACRLRTRIRNSLNEYLKGQAKPKSTVQYLGCSIEYFKKYFESQFTEGMTWEEFLKGNIHIDHRIPCSWFDLNMESEREKCFHYTNLQPLWAKENLEKGARFSG